MDKVQVLVTQEVQKIYVRVTQNAGVTPAMIGNRNDLQTVDKSNLVAAINEVNAKVADVVSSDLIAEAGQNLSSGRVVVIISGIANYFDPNNENMFGLAAGITKTSADVGDQIGIKSFGNFYESGLNLTPGKVYFAGINGTLTLNPENLKIVQQIGTALDSDNLLINIQNSIETL